jgi:hypothetical protein
MPASERVARHCQHALALLWDKSYAPARHFKIAETAQNEIAISIHFISCLPIPLLPMPS